MKNKKLVIIPCIVFFIIGILLVFIFLTTNNKCKKIKAVEFIYPGIEFNIDKNNLKFNISEDKIKMYFQKS